MNEWESVSLRVCDIKCTVFPPHQVASRFDLQTFPLSSIVAKNISNKNAFWNSEVWVKIAPCSFALWFLNVHGPWGQKSEDRNRIVSRIGNVEWALIFLVAGNTWFPLLKIQLWDSGLLATLVRWWLDYPWLSTGGTLQCSSASRNKLHQGTQRTSRT